MSQRRSEWRRWLLLGLAVLFAALLAYLNSGERVSLHLGLFVLYRLPLVAILFVAFLLGMVAMFLIGLRHDMRVRRVLREYRIQEERRPWRTEPPPDLSP